MTLSLRSLVFSAAVLGGCAHTSSIAAFDIGAEPVETPPKAGKDCGWVEVSETKKALFSKEQRQFNDSLFYCCPGENLDRPVCLEANWRVLD